MSKNVLLLIHTFYVGASTGLFIAGAIAALMGENMAAGACFLGSMAAANLVPAEDEIEEAK